MKATTFLLPLTTFQIVEVSNEYQVVLNSCVYELRNLVLANTLRTYFLLKRFVSEDKQCFSERLNVKTIRVECKTNNTQ